MTDKTDIATRVYFSPCYIADMMKVGSVTNMVCIFGVDFEAVLVASGYDECRDLFYLDFHVAGSRVDRLDPVFCDNKEL